MKRSRRFVLKATGLAATSTIATRAWPFAPNSLGLGTAGSLSLHPANPRYFLFRGRPTVLIGSSEHYGSVINRDFDFHRYLAELAACNLNVTRIFTGQYRERPGVFSLKSPSFEIVENTLAPNVNAFIAPWPRTAQPGAGDGGNKFDLTAWNEDYFARLKEFCQAASERAIVVEISLFCPYYTADHGSHFWDIAPFNPANNVHAIGPQEGADALTLKDSRLLAVQDLLVQRIVSDLRDFDNVYYEICNEPIIGRVPLDWQQHIARTIRLAAAEAGIRPLICQEFVDPEGDIQGRIASEEDRRYVEQNHAENRLDGVDILAFHNARLRVVHRYQEVRLPVGENEMIFIFDDTSSRVSAWRILLGGGAFHHGTDYSFTRGHEDGSFRVPAGGAGGGSRGLRLQYGILHRLLDSVDFVAMQPTKDIIASALPERTVVAVLGQAGREYLLHVSRDMAGDFGLRPVPVDESLQEVELSLALPAGTYQARWIDTRTGKVGEPVTLQGRSATVRSPRFTADIALRITRQT